MLAVYPSNRTIAGRMTMGAFVAAPVARGAARRRRMLAVRQRAAAQPR